MELRGRKRIKAGVAALALTVLGATLLVACGGSGGSVSIEVTPATQTGTTVEAKVGDTLVVSLDANATTGYEWAFTAGDTFTIESSQYQEGAHPEGVVGAGGTQIVKLRVTRSGSSELMPLPNMSSSLALSANASTRSISRSSVSEGCRASTSEWVA